MNNVQKQFSPNSLVFDIAVIGGGVIGLSIAYALSKSKKRIVVLEKNIIGGEASWAAAGMLRPVAESSHPEFLSLCLASKSLYPEFIRQLESETGIDIEYTTSGGILLAFSEEEMNDLTEKYYLSRRNNIDARLLSPQEVLILEPSVSPRILGGLSMPTDHHLNNRKLCDALKKALLLRNVELIEQCMVKGFIEKESLICISTSLGSLHAQNVIDCVGSWSSSLLPEFPVKPIRGQMVRMRGKLFNHVLSRHPFYLVPRKDGTIIIGSTVEDVGFSKEVTDEGMKFLVEGAQEMVPALKECEIIEKWAGLRPLSVDQIPIIGKVKEGVYIATGHYRNGILLTPITAKIMHDIILGEKETELFSPLRFYERYH